MYRGGSSGIRYGLFCLEAAAIYVPSRAHFLEVPLLNFLSNSDAWLLILPGHFLFVNFPI